MSCPEPSDVEAEEAGVLGSRDRGLEPPDRLGRLGPDRDDRLGRADREGRDGRALDDRERVRSIRKRSVPAAGSAP